MAPDLPDLPDLPLKAVEDTVHVVQGERVTIELLSNDTAPRQATLTLVEVQAPRHGTLTQQGDTLTYTADADFNGLEVLDYTISDGATARASSKLYLNTFESFADQAPSVLLPRPPGLHAEQLAVVINTSDAYSVAVGERYAEERGVPPEQVLRVDFDGSKDVMSRDDFATLKATIDAQVGDAVQGFALAWLKPYRVDCMSMTSAFALGFDTQYCKPSGGGGPCQVTASVDYFNSYSDEPLQDHALRPAMMLALTNEQDAFELIDRGVMSDGTFPADRGYLVHTTDKNRSVRYADWIGLPARWSMDRGIAFDYLDHADGSAPNVIKDQDDVLFYFTGLTRVADLETNTYRPGAVADHLTSYGGRLSSTSGQMSAVRWLEAGLTASYGTVVEPCNFQQKFPRVSTLLEHYYRGESVLEAYWKSVHWPGEGVFIGEPLARPWGRAFLNHEQDGTLRLGLTWLKPGAIYQIKAADSFDGPWEPVGQPVSAVKVTWTTLEVPDATRPFYRLVEQSVAATP